MGVKKCYNWESRLTCKLNLLLKHNLYLYNIHSNLSFSFHYNCSLKCVQNFLKDKRTLKYKFKCDAYFTSKSKGYIYIWTNLRSRKENPRELYFNQGFEESLDHWGDLLIHVHIRYVHGKWHSLLLDIYDSTMCWSFYVYSLAWSDFLSLSLHGLALFLAWFMIPINHDLHDWCTANLYTWLICCHL